MHHSCENPEWQQQLPEEALLLPGPGRQSASTGSFTGHVTPALFGKQACSLPFLADTVTHLLRGLSGFISQPTELPSPEEGHPQLAEETVLSCKSFLQSSSSEEGG